MNRLFEGSITNIWTMQCYDNFVADIYLEEQEGVYAILDLFTWEGIVLGYVFMMINKAAITVLEVMAVHMVTYLFYLIKIGNMKWGEYYVMVPIYDWLVSTGWISSISGIALHLWTNSSF